MIKNKFIRYKVLFFCVVISLNVFSQEMLFHYNNTVDEKAKKADLISQLSTVWTKFKTTIKDKSNFSTDVITVDVIMLDPSKTGSLVFSMQDSHNVKDVLVDKWKQQYTNEYRVLFYFIKGKNDYVCNKFCVSQKLQDDQILVEVEKFIETQIVLTKKEVVKDAISSGITALTNAFNMDFSKNFVKEATPLLYKTYYYKKYAHVDIYYYYFESSIDNSYKTSKISYITTKTKDKLTTTPLYVSDNVQASLDDLYANKSLFYLDKKDKKSITNTDNNICVKEKAISDYTKDLATKYMDFTNAKVEVNKQLVNFNTLEEYNTNSYAADNTHLLNFYPIMKAINDNANFFKKWNYSKTGGLSYYSVAKYNFCKVQVFSNVTRKGDYMGNLNVNSFYNGYYPTWCNRYAFDLSKSIYGYDPVTDDAPAPGRNGCTTANQQFDIFSSKTDVYVPLEKGKQGVSAGYEDIIWKYINKGYPVYFSYKESGGTGHIETGFPDNNGNLGNSDVYAALNFNKYNDGSQSYCCVGAGSYVGFKTYKNYFFLNNYNSTYTTVAFLYLGYLRNDNL
jgi:hypothetical protein